MRQRYLPRSTEESHFRPIANIPSLRETDRVDTSPKPESQRPSRPLSPEVFRAMTYHEQLHLCGRTSPQTLTHRPALTPSPDSLMEHRLVSAGSAFQRPTSPTLISFGHQVNETLSPPKELVEAYRQGLPVRAPLRITTSKSSDFVRANHRSSLSRVRNYHGRSSTLRLPLI